MPNSIRTPRQGTTSAQKRIAQATDDEGWQKFRVGLKGISTRDKLNKLKAYFSNEDWHTIHSDVVAGYLDTYPHSNCDICIRVDNYVKALCRGGQLYPGESLESMIACGWNPDIKS